MIIGDTEFRYLLYMGIGIMTIMSFGSVWIKKDISLRVWLTITTSGFFYGVGIAGTLLILAHLGLLY